MLIIFLNDIMLSFDYDRSSILLPCIMGSIQTEIKKWSGREYGRWAFDRSNRFPIWYRRNKICSLDLAWYRSKYLYVYHDMCTTIEILPFEHLFSCHFYSFRFKKMIVITGYHGLHITSIYVFRSVFTIRSIRYEDGLRNGRTWTNGRLDHCKE